MDEISTVVSDAMGDVTHQSVSGVPALEACEISKRFGETHVLRAVNLAIAPGEILALMGGNGAGKSTLMKILAGVYSEYDGEVRVNGAPVHFRSVLDAERAGIAIIHQELNLVPELSVAANVFLGREPERLGFLIDRKAATRAAAELLAQLGIAIDPETKVSTLRVGQQQLVEIAKALSLDARILIMDEPTSALSPAECETLFQVVRRLAANGVAIIYISHRMDEVMQLANTVTILRDGRHVCTAPIAAFTRDAIIAAMAGRAVSRAERNAAHVAQTTERPVMLSVRDLSLDVTTPHGMRRVLDGVTFDVQSGEVLGIGGLLGSGRTEILETIFGASSGRRGGTVAIDGVPVTVTNPIVATRHGVALVPEDRKANGLLLDSSIRDNIALPSLGVISSFGIRQFQRETTLASDAVHDLSIRCAGVEQRGGALSGGNQQKVVIAKWLATSPTVLLLDEPTRGIDAKAKEEIYHMIFTLAARGLAIVVVSSELPELMILSDRVLVMCEGRQTGVLARDEATETRIMDLASRGSHLSPSSMIGSTIASDVPPPQPRYAPI